MKPTGSSPRTWGTGIARVRAGSQRRFIPTHVGNRSAGISCHKAGPVHPHARGEQLDAQVHVQPVERFIPTHVGNRQAHRAHRLMWAVHPHARGEQDAAFGGGMNTSGSSPRTWGTGQARVQFQCQERFIPTHVGNSCSRWMMLITAPVHPHARGEQVQGRWRAS